MTQREFSVRQATAEDYDAVAAFTSDIWADRGGDYIPDIYHDWIADDGADQRTFVVDAGDDIAGIAQGVLLSDHEAWVQGMRTNPDFRGEGISTMLNHAAFDWAAERGANVVRNMVFSWNTAGLGASRAAGFEPGVAFRWAQPVPDRDALASLDTAAEIASDPDAAWSYWQQSEGRDVLDGLALDPDESYALSVLTRDTLRDAAEASAVFTVQDDGTRGFAYRNRDYEREEDGETKTYVEYGVAAWDTVDAARVLFAAIAEDAARLDGDDTRVAIPETPRHVTDAAYCRASLSDEPKYVLQSDLTKRT